MSYVVRYYAPIKVKSFKNFIKPQYKYFGLPSPDHYFRLGDKETLVESKNFDLEFKVVNEGFKITQHRVKFDVNMEMSRLETGMKVAMDYTFTDPNGKEIKGNFERLPDPKKKSYTHEVPLGKFKTVEFEIYISVSDGHVKLIPRVGYSKIELE